MIQFAAYCFTQGALCRDKNIGIEELYITPKLVAGEFQGAIQAIRSIGKTEGFRGLFAGYGSFLLRDLPFDAIEFVAYEQLKRSYKASLTEVRDPNSLETSAIGKLCHSAISQQISFALSLLWADDHDFEAMMFLI